MRVRIPWPCGRRAAVSLLLWLTLAAAGLIVACPRPPKAPASPASAADLERYLTALVGLGRPPGLSLAVVENGRVVSARGFGMADGPRQAGATPDTIYRWWSMTKIPTAIAVLQLQERGALALDDPVARRLPFFHV